MAADSIYVNIPSIRGDSTDPAHPNWIDAFALTHETLHPAPSNGGGAGNPQFSDVSFLKNTDGSTIGLHLAVTRGNNLAEVMIDVCRDTGGQEECYYRLTLDQVLVTSHQLSGTTCADPGTCGGSQTESVSFAFGTICWIFTPYLNGQPQGELEECWNVVQNSPF